MKIGFLNVAVHKTLGYFYKLYKITVHKFLQDFLLLHSCVDPIGYLKIFLYFIGLLQVLKNLLDIEVIANSHATDMRNTIDSMKYASFIFLKFLVDGVCPLL